MTEVKWTDLGKSSTGRQEWFAETATGNLNVCEGSGDSWVVYSISVGSSVPNWSEKFPSLAKAKKYAEWYLGGRREARNKWEAEREEERLAK